MLEAVASKVELNFETEFDYTTYFQRLSCFFFVSVQLVLYTFKSSDSLHNFLSQNISQVRSFCRFKVMPFSL